MDRMGGSTRRVVVALMAVGALLGTALPAAAQSVSTSNTQRVLGGLQESRVTIGLSGGATARGNLLRFPANDPHLELRPRLARGTAAGLQTPLAIARSRLGAGAIAGTNGGYWVNRPAGVPNGLHVASGRLVAGQAATVSGFEVSRASLGIHRSGATVMDRVDVRLRLHRPDGTVHVMDEINREPRLSGPFPQPASGELLLYTGLYGAGVTVPSGATVLVVDDLGVGSSGRGSGVVRDVRSGPTSLGVPQGRNLLMAHGTSRDRLAGIARGQQVSVSTQITPSGTDASRWQGLDHAVAAGPLLLRNGSSPSNEQMRAEAFGESHVTGRHPRTAVGRTSGGDLLLLTIDGRQPGWSAGVSLRELVNVMRSLGAVDAVNLDGGGPTTMTVAGRVRNRPSEPNRTSADALLVHAPLPPPARDIREHACPRGAVPDPGFRDSAGSVHTPAIACLAWWGVTEGVGGNRYDPRTPVRRDQMASFVARYLDSASERSLAGARPLPPIGVPRFTDVPPSSVHADAINRLALAGIVQGTSDTTYEPARRVTREQMATFLRRAQRWSSGNDLPGFRDTFMDDNGRVHEDSTNRLAGVQIVTGTGDFNYSPSAPVRRDAMASFLMRGADHLVEQGLTQPPG
jgi:hypothetical protein